MAVIQYTGVVNQIRGKLNGSQFNKARNANTLQKKAQQSKGVKGFQSESREIFQFNQRQWKSRPASEKAQWQLVAQNNPDRDRFGQLVVLSGYNKFLQAMIRSLYSGDSFTGEVDVNPAPSINVLSWGLSGLSFTESEQGTQVLNFTLNIDAGASTPNYSWILDVSLPVSAGVTTYYKRYTWLAGESYDVSLPVTRSQDLGQYFPKVADGQRLIFRLRMFYTGNMVQVFEGFAEYSGVFFPAIASFGSDSYSPTGTRVYTISFVNKNLIDGISYRFEARAGTTVGGCPVPPLGGNGNAQLTNGLFNNQSFATSTIIPSGSCSTIEARIVRVSDNAIMSISSFNISNL